MTLYPATFTRLDRSLFTLLLALLAFKIWLAWGYTMDDAYITIRYAQNWVNFGVLGWNLDDPVPVEGYSNTLFLLISAAVIALQLDSILMFKLVSVFALYVNVGLILFLTRELRPKLQLIALLFYIAYPGFVLWGVSGLESIVFVTFNLLALACFLVLQQSSQQRLELCLLVGILVFLAGLTRPEGPVVGMIIGAVLVVSRLQLREYSRLLREALVMGGSFFLLYGIYFYCRYSYFGELFPNTYYTKANTGLNEVPFEFLQTAALPLLLGALAFCHRQWRFMLVLFAVYIGVTTWLVFGAHPVISFLNRLMLTPLLIAGIAMTFGLEWLLRNHLRTGRVVTVLLTLLCIGMLYSGALFSELLGNTYVKRQQNRADAGEYLMQLGVKSYAMGDVGIIATVTPDVHIYDYYGLNSKKYVSEEIDRDMQKYSVWMVDQQPDAVLLPSEERGRYRLLPGIGIYIKRDMDALGLYQGDRVFEIGGDNYRYKVYLHQRVIDRLETEKG